MDQTLDFSLKTFGCKVNTYDSSLIESGLMRSGLRRAENVQTPKVHVLNSCAVTAEATAEVLREARRLKRKDPAAFVVVTGCSAQVDTDRIAGEDLVDLVVANSDKARLADLIKQGLSGELTERVFRSNIFKKEDFEPGGGTESTKTRTFLKIQDGCNSFCAFCVIPFARGKSRSLPIVDLCRRVQDLHEMGYGEVVLTGVHIGDYEFGLENLVEAVLKSTDIKRIRLSSLEPIEVSDRLLQLFDDPRLCPHFHMSIQSAHTRVLADMKRKYTAQDVERALIEIAKRVPKAFVGMDVIVGFPGEGEEEFFETYHRLHDLPWTRLHVFPYSERPGTFALRLPNKVTGAEIHRRADRLRALSTERYRHIGQTQMGQRKQVLYLKDKSPQGLARDYWPVEIVGSPAVGDEVWVTITGYQEPQASRMDGYLVGQLD